MAQDENGHHLEAHVEDTADRGALDLGAAISNTTPPESGGDVSTHQNLDVLLGNETNRVVDAKDGGARGGVQSNGPSAQDQAVLSPEGTNWIRSAPGLNLRVADQSIQNHAPPFVGPRTRPIQNVIRRPMV